MGAHLLPGPPLAYPSRHSSAPQLDHDGAQHAPVAAGGGQLQDLELPGQARFLLIAAYLASYNPSATDAKFFAKARQRGTHRAT